MNTTPPSATLRRYRGLPALLALVLALFTLTRLVLLAMTGLPNLPLAQWPRIFLLGLWFDGLVTVALLAPLLLPGALLTARFRQGRIYRTFRLAGLWLLWCLLLLAAASEVTFWLEFSTRFNFIAVDYLLYTQEVLGNIRESYPLQWILPGIAVLAALPALWLHRRFGAQPLTRQQRFRNGALAVGLPTLAILLGNIDGMYGSGNAFADELAGNGLMTFAAALRRNELDYDRFYATLPQPEADRILQRLEVERAPLSEALAPKPEEHEREPMGPLARSPRNVVLVSVESLSADFLGSYGGKRHLTPNLDRLAAEGYRFPEVFATGTRTVRGLEALSLGTPPVPGQAIVRRPHNEHLATIGEILQRQGFSSLFIYGGYGYFDNMNAYFQGNDYRIVDRTDFPKDSVAFENAWGVADESLFANAVTAIRQASAGGQRVFAHIMTTSNHRPFTYPDGRIDIASPGGRDGAVKYTDWAIGHFLDEARKEPWFQDTLFVITADHCASVAGKTRLPVDKYRIPMIWYGPGLVRKGEHEGMISQLDLAPTLLDVLGVQGDDHFFGLSVFEQKPALRRAFISNYQSLGYLKHGVLTVLLPRRKIEAYRVGLLATEEMPIPVDPILRDEAIAYYQTAAHAFREGRLASPEYAHSRPGPPASGASSLGMGTGRVGLGTAQSR